MKIQLVKTFPGHETDDTSIYFDHAPIEGAFEKSRWVKDCWVKEGYVIKQKAALNEQGEPFIKTWHEYFTPEKKWFSEGRNHKQIKDGVWERETEISEIFIDIDTLEAFYSFMRQWDGDFWIDDDGMMWISSRFREPLSVHV